jgi:hypothetical protein
MTAEGMLLSLLERNIRQGGKCLPGANALAYFAGVSIMKKEVL